jgi:8-oxo-dGTP pyrophosphatase MutT (NUDIX family)
MQILTSQIEQRIIKKIKSNVSMKLNKTSCDVSISYNVMLITSDHKILLLERSIPFYPQIIQPIYIFPGGHANCGESILDAILRELWEEMSIHMTLRFCQSYYFKVSIYDFIVKRHFNNLIFPAKINLTSCEIFKLFKPTKHMSNIVFIDIFYIQGLYESFQMVQKFMILKKSEN